MSFEWQQIVTHLVGFLIFVWVLKKFAWGPLLTLMDERRDKIAGEFARIDQEKAAVAELTEQYQSKLAEIDSERRARLVEAVDEGKKIAEQIKVDAEARARELAEKAKVDLEREVTKAKGQLKEDMVRITMSAAEKIIGERLDDAKHHDLIGNFIDNVEKA